MSQDKFALYKAPTIEDAQKVQQDFEKQIGPLLGQVETLTAYVIGHCRELQSGCAKLTMLRNVDAESAHESAWRSLHAGIGAIEVVVRDALRS